MKNKKVNILFVAVLIVISFFSGKISNYHLIQTDYEKSCDVMAEIVDWNTDGNELEVFTKDGFEFYAYKSEDIYKNKNFIPLEEEK